MASSRSLTPYLDWLADSISPVVRAWSPSAVRVRREAAARALAVRTESLEWSRTYASACPVAGTRHEDYRLRELRLASGASLLAGIHFRAGDLRYPFVGVFAQSRWLSPAERLAAHVELMGELAPFAPRASWWWTLPGKEPARLGAERVDQHLVMGSLREVRARPAPPLPRGWQIRVMGSADAVQAAFERLYDDFHRARPDLRDAVPCCDREDLNACARAGGLIAAFEGNALVGLLAARPGCDHALEAWLICDLVLARAHCRRGLGPALQRAALDRLDAARAPFVVGTIEARNLPSWRTALRVGRRVVGSWIFLEPGA